QGGGAGGRCGACRRGRSGRRLPPPLVREPRARSPTRSGARRRRGALGLPPRLARAARVRARVDDGPERSRDTADRPLPARAGRGDRRFFSRRAFVRRPLGRRDDDRRPGAAAPARDGNVRSSRRGGGQGGVGGGLELNEELAREACARLGSRLGLSAEEAARATVEVAHAQIERALRLVTVRRGHDLRACTLVAYGGAGPMHAGAVALSAGVERVLVPALSSTFSALGCCLSELAIDDVRTCLARLDQVDWPRVERELEGLVGEIAATLENDRGALRVFRSLELRYRDQNDTRED